MKSIDPADPAFYEPIRKGMRDLGLDPDDDISCHGWKALHHSKALMQPGRKKASREYGEKLSRLSQEGEKMRRLISAIDGHHINTMLTGLSVRHNINIDKSTLLSLMEGISEVAEMTRNIYIDPIPDGYYNGFLWCFVDSVLKSPSLISMAPHGKAERFMLSVWPKFREHVIDVSVTIIQKELSQTQEIVSIRKTVDRHIDRIAEERIRHFLSLSDRNIPDTTQE